MAFIQVRSVIVLALILAVLPSQAQSYKALSEAQLYGSSRERVWKGHDLERAISMLSALVERKPGDADYQMTLGCACAARLASLHCAMEDAKIVESARRGYSRRVKIWQAMQDDPTFPLFGKPQPVAPVDPVTPDDGKAYDPADLIVQKRVTDLSLLALHHLHEALRLGRSLPLKHKTEVDYTCGWGLLLVYRSAKDSIKYQESIPPVKPENATLSAQADPEAKKDKTLTHEEIIACFQAYADSTPKNADYWQSLAFAYAPDYLTDIITYGDGENIAQAQTDRIEEAVKSLQRALALPGKRSDPDLLYQSALLASEFLPEKALDSLKKLIGIQNANAVNFYLLAGAYLKQAGRLEGEKASQAKQDALSAIESGNQAPQYYNATMILPVPKLITPAWTYHRTYGLGLDSHCLDSLFGFLAGIGADNIQHKEGESLLRNGVAMIEMGLNALRHYEGTDLDQTDLRTHLILYDRAFYGMLCCGKGFKFIRAAVEISPSPSSTALAEDYARSAAYWKAWDKALTQ